MHPPPHVEPGPGSLIYLYLSSLFLSFLKIKINIYILYIYIYIYILILNIREGGRSEMSIYKGTRTWFHVIFVFIMLKMNFFFRHVSLYTSASCTSHNARHLCCVRVCGDADVQQCIHTSVPVGGLPADAISKRVAPLSATDVQGVLRHRGHTVDWRALQSRTEPHTEERNKHTPTRKHAHRILFRAALRGRLHAA